MNIIAKYPYSFLFGGAGLVLIVIFLAARGQTAPTAANTSFIAIEGGGGLIAPGISAVAAPNASAPTPFIEQTPVSPYVPIMFASTTPDSASSAAQQITTNNPSGGAPSAFDDTALLQEAYSLIPSSFAPTQMQQTAAVRTPQQQALYQYGNEAGLVILTFENNQANMTQTLKDWLADATSTAQIAQVDTLAQALTQAGTQLAGLSDVPPSAQAANSALGQSLEIAGSDLKTVAASGGNDTTLTSAMKTYDASADTFTADFLAVSDLFSLNQVTFSASDPGSAFQFSSAGNL